MVRGTEIVAAELKKLKGKPPPPAQMEWQGTFIETGKVAAFVWRPTDWVEIEEVLGRK